MTVPEGAQGLIGKHYRQLDYFEVGREKIREFAIAVKDDHPTHFNEADAAAAGYPSVLAPLTFVAIAGRRVQLEDLRQVQHPHQHRPGFPSRPEVSVLPADPCP